MTTNPPIPRDEYLITLEPLCDLEVAIFSKLRFPIYTDPDSSQRYVHRGWFRNADDVKRSIVV